MTAALKAKQLKRGIEGLKDYNIKKFIKKIKQKLEQARLKPAVPALPETAAPPKTKGGQGKAQPNTPWDTSTLTPIKKSTAAPAKFMMRLNLVNLETIWPAIKNIKEAEKQTMPITKAI